MYSGVIESHASGDRRRFGASRLKSRTWVGGPGGSNVDQFDLL